MGSSIAFRRTLALLLAAGACACGASAHEQADGTYVLTADQVLRDDCHLAATPPKLWNGAFWASGNVAWMNFDLYTTRLTGLYEKSEEVFQLDGSASQVQATLQGVTCTIDMANIHVDGTTDSPTTFHGNLKVSDLSLSSNACTCQLWATFHATRQ